MSNIAVFKQNLRRRIDESRLSDIALAKAAGLPRDSVRDIFRGKASEPGVLKAAALARQLGCSIEELLDANAPLTSNRDNYLLIALYDTRAAAGAGGTGGDEVREHVLFPKGWLRSMTQGDHEHLALIDMDGDSMEPALRSGDQGLIDLSQRNPLAHPGIYVLFTDGGLQVKRVAAHPVDGTLRIASDNPAYPSYDGVDAKDVRIIGRVIWVGRRI